MTLHHIEVYCLFFAHFILKMEMDLMVEWHNYFSANITNKKIPISTFILHLLPNYKGIVFVSLYFFQKATVSVTQSLNILNVFGLASVALCFPPQEAIK